MENSKRHPLVEWAETQPRWQRDALRRLAKVGSVDDLTADDEKEIRNIIAAEAVSQNININPITDSDISGPDVSEPSTYLKLLGPVSNIDKLASDQPPFEFLGPSGMTVIFGNNGSGKSGYARILKNLCRSHGTAKPLKNDATAPEKNLGWSVNIKYAEKVDEGSAETEKFLKWKKSDEEDVHPELRRIAFFDNDVANIYVDKDRDISYFPMELRLYAELARLADKFKEELNESLWEAKIGLPSIPRAPEGTELHRVLSLLDPDHIFSEEFLNLTEPKISEAIKLTKEEHQELLWLRITNLQTPEERKNILQKAKTTLVEYRNSVEEATDLLSSNGLRQLQARFFAHKEKEEKAQKGIASIVEDMPRKKAIGSDTWLEMFRAARQFAGEVHQDGSDPKIATGEYCVLCLQDLDESAKSRLIEFDAFIDAKLRTDADSAKSSYQNLCDRIKSLAFDADGMSLRMHEFGKISDERKTQVDGMIADIGIILSRKEQVVQIIESENQQSLQEAINDALLLRDESRHVIDEIDAELVEIEKIADAQDADLLAIDEARLADLESRYNCQQQIDSIIMRRRALDGIKILESQKGLLDTHSITTQASKRNRELFSENLEAKYNDEICELSLAYLGISVGNRSSKGTPKIYLNMKGLKASEKSEILSEGEQRAVALAGFLTEVNEVNTRHAIVLDDPVSSLDWDRKELIAMRLAKEASKRQVIIFTHDVGFAMQLDRQCKNINGNVSKGFFLQQWIGKESIGSTLRFGVTGESMAAWETKNVNVRLREIRKQIDELENSGIIPDGTGHSEFEIRVAQIETKLRKTWERAVEEIALHDTIRRFAPEVRTQSLKNVKFGCTDEDYRLLHEGMSAISTPTHDAPQSGGSAAPSITKLRRNLECLKKWIARFPRK